MVFEVELFFYPPKSPLSKGDFQVGGLSSNATNGDFLGSPLLKGGWGGSNPKNNKSR